MYGIGIDTVAIQKFKRVLAASGGRFVKNIFTKNERNYCQSNGNPEHSFAGHFAAKEALLKAVPHLKSNGIDFNDIEIAHDNFGAPFFNIHGRLKQNLDRHKIRKLFLSISHSSESAIAFVIAN